MALDTAQKRYSMINFSKPTNFMLFQVDGSVDADDKYHLLHLYSEITLDSPVASTYYPQKSRVMAVMKQSAHM